MQNTTHAQVERYLLKLRSALGGLHDAEKAEIISDIRNHIEERLAELGAPDDNAIGQVLTALGGAEALAVEFQRERLIAQAAFTVEPMLLLRATFQWALTAVSGVAAFVLLLFGYSIGLALVVCAALKPIMPQNIGLWVDPPAFTLGYLNPMERHGHELLGWWILPVGYVGGVLLLVATTRLVRWILRLRAANSPSILQIHQGQA